MNVRGQRWIKPFVALLILQLPLLAQERSRRNPYTSPEDIGVGERRYRRLCSNCHGQNGRGVAELGPNLIGKLSRGSDDGELFDVVTGGIPGTGMPAFSFSERQAWQVVAYLRSIGGGVGGDMAGDSAAGEALFRGDGGCIGCHQIAGQGGRSGPDLRSVAAFTTASELRESILHANKTARARHFRVRAVTRDGKKIEGRRLNEDTYSIQILDADEQLVSLDKTKLFKYEVVKESIMPAFASVLTDAQVSDLIAYLSSLAQEGTQ